MSRPIRFTFILFLAALGTALAAVGGWRYARASAPLSGPIIVISIDTLRADHLPRLRLHQASRRQPSTRSRPTASSSSGRIRTRRRRCRRTPRCCRDGCRSRPACATTSASAVKTERAAAAADAARSRLHHRRRRLGVRAAARKPASARGSTSSTARCRRLAGAIGRSQRDGAESEAIAERWLDVASDLARLPVPAPRRAAQAVRAAGSLRRVSRPTTARSPTATKSSAGWCAT